MHVFICWSGRRSRRVALDSHRPLVEKAAEPWQVWFFDKMRYQVSGYVDELKKYLLIQRPFGFHSDRSIDFGTPAVPTPPPTPPGLSAMCEQRCRQIRHSRFSLTRPDVGAPILPQSLAFAKLGLDQFSDKKQMIHERPWPVDRASLGLRDDDELERCARSVWVYDRIMHYKVRETQPIAVAAMIRLTAQELEKAQAQDEPSLMALHYAVKTLVTTMHRSGGEAVGRREAGPLVEELQSFLERAGAETHPKIVRNLSEIRALLGPPQPAA